MITAIVMIDVEVDKIPDVASKIASAPQVTDVYSVTGNVDLIAIVKTPQYDDLATIVPESIAKIPGVKSLTTHLAFKEYSSQELASAFDLGLD
ncbi:MAG: Lrp/AsnC ligand binding domain-containing protein [Actinomycetaceae bacterium]|nr:Lrp/AsnC ligand binding domain-containing protein [Actinomycetaceae bacterium]